MITYSQGLGQFSDDDADVIVSGCYSGGDHGENPNAVNNPSLQAVVSVGPIPRGFYAIGRAMPIGPEHTGSFVLPLTPDAFTRAEIITMGRDPDSFYLHGDNPEMNRSASDGCIICPRDGRVKIDAMVAAGNNQLSVTA